MQVAVLKIATDAADKASDAAAWATSNATIANGLAQAEYKDALETARQAADWAAGNASLAVVAEKVMQKLITGKVLGLGLRTLTVTCTAAVANAASASEDAAHELILTQSANHTKPFNLAEAVASSRAVVAAASSALAFRIEAEKAMSDLDKAIKLADRENAQLAVDIAQEAFNNATNSARDASIAFTKINQLMQRNGTNTNFTTIALKGRTAAANAELALSNTSHALDVARSSLKNDAVDLDDAITASKTAVSASRVGYLMEIDAENALTDLIEAIKLADIRSAHLIVDVANEALHNASTSGNNARDILKKIEELLLQNTSNPTFQVIADRGRTVVANVVSAENKARQFHDLALLLSNKDPVDLTGANVASESAVIASILAHSYEIEAVKVLTELEDAVKLADQASANLAMKQAKEAVNNACETG
ncbi:hypothetical protein BV898_12203 [Hypsibius exemplaris]|uniref:Uncharacterized protein n=1 Tax=Hypsibius exemplaris TaxID=2072580 RepID=A0A1W0WEC9_HYPEX|nr:hypothetical protein BV898_12203 [Hypsibius exemplaris]